MIGIKKQTEWYENQALKLNVVSIALITAKLNVRNNRWSYSPYLSEIMKILNSSEPHTIVVIKTAAMGPSPSYKTIIKTK